MSDNVTDAERSGMRACSGLSRETDAGVGSLRVEAISHAFPAPGVGWLPRRAARVPVLADVSFDADPGTLTAILGPSGCGKSTLLRLLAGLETPTAGRMRLGGVELAGAPGGVAYHPQRDALLPWLRVLDNATLGAETCGVDRAEARRAARSLLHRFGLAGLERAWPDELSGGMRQRVALMRTFLMPQPILALDEPLGALDALTRRQLQHWLIDIVASDARPILLVTHDIDEALLLADRILVLSTRPGRIVHVEERPDAAARLREHENGSDRGAARRLLGWLGGSA
ncbi:ABC transporter ATP-binding protein [Leucobacter sp. NPDC015123]|uniref:ABC transporter ATP-binding protein n=1 Tax=Leucobacter sp. NPDC015123 TaxID=3364129 RepID=UPI0036F465B2